MDKPHFFDTNEMEWRPHPLFPTIMTKSLETRASYPAASVTLVKVGVGGVIDTHVHEAVVFLDCLSLSCLHGIKKACGSCATKWESVRCNCSSQTKRDSEAVNIREVEALAEPIVKARREPRPPRPPERLPVRFSVTKPYSDNQREGKCITGYSEKQD